MSLFISYQDSPGKTIYANLFSATNKNQAYNPITKTFLNFTLASQPDFGLILSESSERVGNYSIEIADTSGIPATSDGDFYLVEVFEVQGSGLDRELDRLQGTMAFYWDGTREVDICGCQSSAGTNLTAADIWEYPDRTLTQDIGGGSETPGETAVEIDLTCPDPYINVEVETDLTGVENRLDVTDAKIDQLITLVRELGGSDDQGTVLPNTSTPIIGPRGSSAGGQSSIRIT